MNPITFTKPIALFTRQDGLTAYQYELNGLVESVNTVFCKTVREAISHAKRIIEKYILRMEMASKLTVKHADSQGIIQSKKESGWNNINYDVLLKTWRVKNHLDGKSWHVGNYKTLISAVAAKKADNVKHGLPPFHSRKK